MATPDNPTPAEAPRFSIRLPRPLWIGVAAVVLTVVVATVWRQCAGLSRSERLLVGKWTFRTWNKTNQLFAFREDRIAALMDVD